MKNPLISIIIPFYNEEKFLPNSILSALNQTYKSIEIILIDDFSTDESPKIAEEFANNHPHIKLFTSYKKGVGAARNTGLNKLSGEYFTFLDADDKLSEDFIQVCYDNISSSNCEISVVNTKVFDIKSKEINTPNPTVRKDVLSGSEALRHLYSFQLIASVWGKLFKSSLISGTLFNEEFIFEDKPFLVEVLLKTNKIHLSNEKLYFHYANPNSISRSVIDPPRINDSTKSFMKEVDLLLNSKDKKNLLSLSFNYQYFIMLDLFFLMCIDEKRIDKKSMEKVFLTDLKQMKNRASLIGIKPNGKKRILLIILGSIKILGWNIPFNFLKRYFNKHFTFIQSIKE